MSDTTQTASAPKLSGKGLFEGSIGKGILVGGVLAALFLIVWVFEMVNGMAGTGMRSLTPWGLGIICFMFFVGLSAGSLLIGAAAVAFGFKGLEGLPKTATWIALACGICAGAAIVSDIGNPLRTVEMLFRGNMSSPLMWDMIGLILYLAVAAVFLVFLIQADAGKRDAKAVKLLAILSIVAAVALQVVEALIFSAYTAHEYWHTALLGPWFITSALASGSALLLLVAHFMDKAGELADGAAAKENLAKLMGVFLCVDALFLLCDLVTTGYAGGEGAQIVSIFTAGPLAPFFWGQLVCYAVAAAIAFAPSLRASKALAFGAVIAMCGVFCKRVELLLGGYQVSNFDAEGTLTSQMLTNWDGGMAAAYSGLVYVPSAGEACIAVGLVGLGILVVLLGVKLLPLFDHSK